MVITVCQIQIMNTASIQVGTLVCIEVLQDMVDHDIICPDRIYGDLARPPIQACT
jgi:hypothetical protein